ncbi:mitochondrial ribosomal protein L49 [Leptinotarsa decemlineata]|uniref:mitochondrial ribosomal protein L49 n=1 Tax=Leptinotarsa decemlineata TaxID=7539 RepID=UPI000C2555D2|nr:probable 39S ribosomal protein L49, mitochondrial [Leptinotarsa decemlineata]
MAGITSASRRLLSACLSVQNKTLQFVRWSSYKSSPFLEDVEVNTKYEVTKDPHDWQYVQRALPVHIVPEPLKKEVYPSGWKPQGEEMKSKPYFVERTRNHMIPVYLKLGQRGIRKHTIIKNIQGNIFQLENDLLKFLHKDTFKPVRSHVNEFAGFIRMNGDYVNAVKYWLEQHQF